MAVEMGEDGKGDFVQLLDADGQGVHRTYNTDCSFWSHDDKHKKFADNATVYDRLCKPVVQKTIEGTGELST